MVSSSLLCCAGKVEYQEEDRERRDGCVALDWLLGSRVAAGQKQFTQNMVKIFNDKLALLWGEAQLRLP